MRNTVTETKNAFNKSNRIGHKTESTNSELADRSREIA